MEWGTFIEIKRVGCFQSKGVRGQCECRMGKFLYQLEISYRNIFSLAYCLMPLTEWMENKAIAGYRLNFPLVIVNAASLIATAIVYASMKKLEENYGYTLNMYYLAVTPFFMCMTTEIKLDTTTVIRFAIYFVIWTIPNYIYFKKREQLFINS